MQGRFIGAMVCIWALQGLPVLCTAGVIWHACASDCPCNHPCDHHPPADCGHEQDCPDDPCSGLSVSADRLARFDDLVPDAAAVFVSALTDFNSEEAHAGTLAAAVAAPDLPELPYPRSDLPLRI